MNTPMNRRQFTKTTVATLAGMTAVSTSLHGAEKAGRTARLGFIGVGGRGTSLLRNTLGLKPARVTAVCDVNPASAARAQKLVVAAGQPEPAAYTKSETDFERMLQRDDVDAVVISTPWEWHAPMAVAAMKQGKYVGVEVPCAITLEECWQLIRTNETTGVPCMMLENWSFRRDNLAVLNMIRQGLFGQIVHCHSAHSHNCIYWYMDARGYPRWSGKHLLARCADQYPTHTLGPVLSWMDINCGDRFETIVSMATGQFGITDQLTRRYGADHEPASYDWRQGDVVTSLIRTAKGKTIVVNMDMQLPRPYDNRWMIQGTRGLYSEERDSVYLAGLEGPAHRKEEWELFKPFQEKYDHRWWTEAISSIPHAQDHGGTDSLQMHLFVEAVRTGTPLPLDVYDSVVMSCLFPLSEQSIAAGSQPIACPDFTSGKWKTRKPYFALES